jgi:lysophospholipase L1-like esterase
MGAMQMNGHLNSIRSTILAAGLTWKQTTARNVASMKRGRLSFGPLCCLLLSGTGVPVAAQALEPADLRVTGDWQIQATVQFNQAKPGEGAKTVTETLAVSPAALLTIQGERHAWLPLFNPQAGGWSKGPALQGVKAQECATLHLLDPQSLTLRTGPEAAAPLLELGKDYAADLAWGTFGRLPGGRIQEGQTVFASYRHGELRIDSVILTPEGRILLRQGEPRSAAPMQPPLKNGERRLANIWLPGRVSKLSADHLFPISETAYPEPPPEHPAAAEKYLPKAMQKLRDGSPLRILAWGDSVTVGSYLPDPAHERWQEQFVARLRQRFPAARIELLTEAWGGRNTGSYLSEPPGSAHNYQQKVLDTKPDLIVSEFVNDAGLTPDQVETRYGKLLADFKRIGAEWIILTPHYVRPDWMGLTKERDIDDDPRPYVKGLRRFAARYQVALADAALRCGRLWRQGIPYSALMLNSINHPDARGMSLFADSLMALFPLQ